MNFDTRHPVLNNGLDDRKEQEKRIGGIENSRAGPINYYISNDKRCFHCYNDRRYTINKKVKKTLLKLNKEENLGMDKRLMNHFAYNMVRDNICIFLDDFEEEKVEKKTHLFEAFQSTNWNDVRFKPPPSYDSEMLWRVEFRPIGSQMTQAQNFLFSHAVYLFERMITSDKMRLNLYIPNSLVKYIFYFLIGSRKFRKSQ